MLLKELWITTHGGKLQGLHSLGTTCLCNEYCKKRAENKESVCSKCYASRYMHMRKSLNDHLFKNSIILSNKILYEEELPLINDLYFRFESFGDLINDVHLINYINICKVNKHTTFALWTKNVHILKKVFLKMNMEKPKNLIIVVSSDIINKKRRVPKGLEKYIDKIFTVYTKEYATKHNIAVNCGSKKCLNCLLCYTHNDVKEINEILK